MKPVNTPNAPAFYAVAPGGAWKDYLNLLHLPYTGWHLSYVVMGAAIAPAIHLDRLLATLLAFFLAVGIAAFSLGGAVALGILGGLAVTLWIFPFVAFGGFIVVAYNSGLWKDRFHSDIWFAVAWGGFPPLTAYWVQAESLTASACLVAAGCFAFSLAQRALSTQVRNIRRRTIRLEGSLETTDGTVLRLERAVIIAAPERALGLMSVTAVVLAAVAALAARGRAGFDGKGVAGVEAAEVHDKFAAQVAATMRASSQQYNIVG